MKNKEKLKEHEEKLNELLSKLPSGEDFGETVRSMNVTQLIDMQESLDKLNKFLEDHLNKK